MTRQNLHALSHELRALAMRDHVRWAAYDGDFLDARFAQRIAHQVDHLLRIAADAGGEIVDRSIEHHDR